MDPEVWIGIAAVFVSGGAVGTAGTLMAVWLLGKIGTNEPPRRMPAPADLDLLRGDVSEMDRRLRNIDARLEFQEQLLAGASPTKAPPPRLAEPPPPLGHAAAEPSASGESGESAAPRGPHAPLENPDPPPRPEAPPGASPNAPPAG